MLGIRKRRRKHPNEALRAKAAKDEERQARRDDVLEGRVPLTTRDPDVVAAVRDYERVLREADEAGRLPDPSPELPACPMHPEWQPKHWTAGQPRPPSHMCPFCRVEAEKGRRPSRHVETVEVAHPLQVKDTGAIGLAGMKHEDNEEDRAAELAHVPGSFAQQYARSPDGRAALTFGNFKNGLDTAALERIEELREEEREREKKKSGRGRLVSGRIEGGEWVEYRAPARRAGGRTPFVRVAP